MRCVSVGYARSGTKSIAHFFKLFGIPAFHQRVMPGHLRDELNRKCDYPYDYADVSPPHVELFLDRQDAVLKKFSDNYFEANWSKSYYMLPTYQRHPDIEWLVMIRNPLDAVNSLKAHRRHGVSLRDLGIHYTEMYLAILQQIQRMDNSKVHWMDFDKYISSDYILPLFYIFDIPRSDENISKAKEFLSEKVNPGRFPYKPLDDSRMFQKWFANCSDSFFTFVNRITDCIKNACKELGN